MHGGGTSQICTIHIIYNFKDSSLSYLIHHYVGSFVDNIPNCHIVRIIVIIFIVL